MNGVKPVRPPWPVRPMTPATKDREPGQRRKEPPPPPAPEPDPEPDDDDRQPTIDEYV